MLEEALARRGHDADLLLAAALFARDLGRKGAALRYARALAETWPELPQGRALLGELEATPP